MHTHDLLIEEVFSSLAIGYHRTRNLQNTNAIGESGFKAGDRGTYGRGIYLTYNFDDQQDDRMKELYGPFIVRCKINLTDFLIFDRDIAARVYGGRGSLEEQLARFGDIRPSDSEFDPIRQMFRHYENARETGLTSTAAKMLTNWLVTNATKVRLRRPIKGLVFTGAQDGRVIVAYDPTTVIPFAWARVTNLDKTRETVRWNKIAMPPVAAAPPEQMPEFERAYRFFREEGFLLVSRGSAGAILVGIRNGGYITINVTNVLAKAFVTQRDPVAAAKKLPGYYEQLGHRLYYQEFPDGHLPLRKIANVIYHNADELAHRPDRHVQFTEALFQKLLKPGFHVQRQDVRGVDYRRDKILLTAGSIKAEIDMPYYEHTSAKVWVETKPWPLRLGFNDGTHRDSSGGTPDLNKAYAVLIGMVAYERFHQHLTWPDDLQPQFVNDLMAAFRSN